MAAYTHAVDVLVDSSGRLGALSYLVPAGVAVEPGDAVTVPFGKQTRHGLVLGPSADPTKATRELDVRLGQRCLPIDMEVARALAERHGASFGQIAGRLSPTTDRAATPLDAGPLVLRSRADDVELPDVAATNRLYLRAPSVSSARIAALDALRLHQASGGQVLILTPSTELLELVVAEFESGAVRLDSKARSGAWPGFRQGTVPVGVGSRAAALYSPSTLAGIILVEEDHPGHIEVTVPYTHVREVAAARCAAHGVPLTLVSANPTASGMGAKVKVGLVGRPQDWPRVQVIDRTTVAPGQQLLPPALRGAIKGAQADGLPVLVLADSRPARRLCAKCGDPRPCGQCSVSGCAHTDITECQRCGHAVSRWAGWDVTRLGGLLPEADPVVFSDLRPWPSARMVVLFDVDGLSSQASLEPEHGFASVLMRAAEAAGPGGRVVALTSQPVTPVLSAFMKRDALTNAKHVWARAKNDGLPPFGVLVTVRANWERQPSTAGWPGTVFGPRRKGTEWEIMVSCDHEQLPALMGHVDRMRRRGKVRVSIR